MQIDGRMFDWMELGHDEPLCKIGLYEEKEGKQRRASVHSGLTLDTDDIQGF